MFKKLIFTTFALLIGLSLASAADTDITIKTLASEKVSIFVYPAGELSSVETYHLNSDSSGNLEFTHSSEHDNIDIRVIVKIPDGENLNELFEGYDAGSPISIRLDYEVSDGEYSEVAEEVTTEEEVEEEVEEVVAEEDFTEEEVLDQAEDEIESSVSEGDSEESKEPVTGEAISDINSGNTFSTTLYLIIIGIVTVLVVLLLLIKKFGSQNSNKWKSPTKTSEVGHVVGGTAPDGDLKQQLKESQREIKKLKRDQKAREIEFRIEEEKKQLERIREGKDDDN